MKRIRLCAFMLLAASSARASDWGCQVLLCLSNPAGPTAVAACVPPITKLWNALKKRNPDPFPTCEEAGDSFAKPGYGSFYDACPNGTKALAVGTAAIQMSPTTYADLAKSNPAYFGTDVQTSTKAVLKSSPVVFGIGEGDGLDAGPESLPSKVCVRNELGSVVVQGATYEDGQIRARAFEQVVHLSPYSSASYIDVFVNGKLHNRVRY